MAPNRRALSYQRAATARSGLYSDDAQSAEFIGIIGAGERHSTLSQSCFGGAFVEQACLRNTAVCKLLVAPLDQPHGVIALRGTHGVDRRWRGLGRNSLGRRLGACPCRQGCEPTDGAATGGGVTFGRTINVDLASARIAPSLETMVTLICDLPLTAPGSMTLRFGSAATGTAQAPGAMECPAESAARGGRPYSLTMLPRGKAAAGPTVISSAVSEGASASRVAAMVTDGVGLRDRLFRKANQHGESDSHMRREAAGAPPKRSGPPGRPG